MKVLVLGASGFIGRAVTDAFVRAGHIVWGQTRSESTAADFSQHEILPVVCDPIEGKAVWTAIAKDVDVLVDCSTSAGGADKALTLFHAFTAAVAHRPKGSPLPAYIYTSGHYVMARGEGSLAAWSDERQPADAPVNTGTAWRSLVEVPVMQSDAVHGVVIRPVCLYGRAGSYFSSYHFDAAYEAVKAGNKAFASISGGKVATIHADDLAELYVRVAELAPVVRGQAVVASNPSTDSFREILDGVVRVAGLESWTEKKPADAYEVAWVTPLMNQATLGRALTGWVPRKMGLSDAMDVYWHSYVAARKAAEKNK